MKIKRLLSCGLVTAMLLGMTACDEGGTTPATTSGVGPGTSSATTTATTADPDENAATDAVTKELDTGSYTPDGNSGTVKFLGYYDITGDQKGAEQVKVFKTETYGGNIEWISSQSGAAYYEKLATLVAADDSPDLLTYEPLAFPYGVSKNMFEPLDEHFNIDDPLWADMKPMIEEYEFGGKHYYFPHRMVTKYSLNYNRKTVERAGLTDPYDLYRAGEWTWDAWREMMIEFCNQDNANIGFYATSTMLEAFVNTTGTSLIDVAPDGTITNNIQSTSVTRAIEYLAELGRNSLLYPADHPYGDWVSPQIWAPASDKILFLGMEPEWTYIAATEQLQNPQGVDNDIFNTPSDLAFVPFPRDPQADAYYASTGTFGYMIPKGAKNMAGAVEFIYCNRLFETDQAIIEQVRKDHIDPEIITYTTGKYEGIQKWQITWDAEVYDLWRECVQSDSFEYVTDYLFGFDQEVKVNICTAMYDSTFGTESWTQKSEEIYPLVETVLDEYRK